MIFFLLLARVGFFFLSGSHPFFFFFFPLSLCDAPSPPGFPPPFPKAFSTVLSPHQTLQSPDPSSIMSKIVVFPFSQAPAFRIASSLRKANSTFSSLCLRLFPFFMLNKSSRAVDFLCCFLLLDPFFFLQKEQVYFFLLGAYSCLQDQCPCLSYSPPSLLSDWGENSTFFFSGDFRWWRLFVVVHKKPANQFYIYLRIHVFFLVSIRASPPAKQRFGTCSGRLFFLHATIP